MMGLGVSIFLMAVGAVLAFAVSAEAEGFDVNTVGVILMIVGALGFIASLIVWGGFGDREERIIREDHHHSGHGHV